MKIETLSKGRALRLVLDRFHEIERTWDDRPRRKRLLRDLRHFLVALKDTPELGLHHIAELSRHIDESVPLPHLCGLLVPVEREHERANITDEDFLVTTEDLDGGPPSTMPVTVVLDNIRSAFNVGGILRTGECAGVEKLVLCGYTATSGNPKVGRAALGTQDLVPWEQATSAEKAVEALRSEGVSIVALETVSRCPAHHETRFEFPCAMVLGNERFGLSRGILAAADHVVSIPVYGRKNSLNVVSAFAVCAYELRRQWEEVHR